MPELSLSWSFVGMWCVCVLLNENKKQKVRLPFPSLLFIELYHNYNISYIILHLIWTSAMQSIESCLQKVQIAHSKQVVNILYFIIVREGKISGTIAPRGLKFWLQVGLGPPITTPWTLIRKSGSGKSGFSGNFFFAFFASMDLLGPQGHPPDVPVPPNPDPDREIRFFENPDFSFFRLFKL